jgi:hypothetical protein
MRVKTCTACEIILVSTQDEHPCYPEVATVQELNEVMGYARSAYSYWISRIAEDVRYMLEVWDQASLLGDKANAHLARAKATKDEVIRRSEERMALGELTIARKLNRKIEKALVRTDRVRWELSISWANWQAKIDRPAYA